MRARHDVGHGAVAGLPGCARRRACPQTLAGSCRAVLPGPVVYDGTNTTCSAHQPRSSISPALKIDLSHPQLCCPARLAAG